MSVRVNHTTGSARRIQMKRWSGLRRDLNLLTLWLAIYDPNDSKFDLEKLLEKVSAENP